MARRPRTDAHRVVVTVATRIAVAGASAVGTVVIARALHPAGQGTYGLVITVATTAYMLGHLSIEQSDVLLWHRGEDRAELASTTVLLGVAAGTVAAVAAWVVVLALGPSSFSARDRILVALASAGIPLMTLYTYLFGLNFLAGRTGRVNVARLLSAATQLLVLAALIVTGHLTVRTAVLVWVSAAAALPVLLAAPGLGIRLGRVSWRMARALMHTGFRYHLGMAALFLLWRIDTFLLNAQASRHEVGLYVVAVTTAEALYLVTDSVAQVSLPRQLEGTLAEAAAFTARITRLNTLVATAAGLGIVALGPVLVPLVFGGDYGGSVGPLLALVPGVVALGMIRPITPILVRLNRPLRVSLFCSLALLLNVALNFALIPVAGAVGAATASSVAYAALAVAYVRWLISATSLELSDLWPTRSDIGSLRWRTLRTRTARSAPLPPETRPAAESGVEG